MSTGASQPAHASSSLLRPVGSMLLTGGLLVLVVGGLARIGRNNGPGLEPTPMIDGRDFFWLMMLASLQILYGVWLLVVHWLRAFPVDPGQAADPADPRG